MNYADRITVRQNMRPETQSEFTVKIGANVPATLAAECRKRAHQIKEVFTEDPITQGGRYSYWIHLRSGWWNWEASTVAIRDDTVAGCLMQIRQYIAEDPRPVSKR
jgi:hypothetical protein